MQASIRGPALAGGDGRATTLEKELELSNRPSMPAVCSEGQIHSILGAKPSHGDDSVGCPQFYSSCWLITRECFAVLSSWQSAMQGIAST